jgi:MoaA/NifB/PqqE/SkfB family radical SAM enzyme
MNAFRKNINRMRFSYHRSFRRANSYQLRRFVDNLISRPPGRNPRRFMSVGLTHRCQCRCEWCATGVYRKNAADEFTTREVEGLLGAISRSRYVFDNISFLGGECLLRDDIYHLVRYAVRLGLFVHLSTNGLKLDEECVRLLLQAGLNSIFIAFAPEQPRNAAEKKRSESVLRGAQLCVEWKLPCFFSICASRENVFSGELERAIETAKQLGLAGVRLMPIRLSGKWLFQDSERALSRDEEWKVRSLCDSGFAFLTDDSSNELDAKCPTVDRRIVYVSPYGDVQPCHFFPFSFGNVRTATLDSILDRMWAHPLIQSDGNACLLHDADFRLKNIAPISSTTNFPINVLQ